MAKALVWYGLFLKQNLKKWSTWMMLGAMFLLLWLVDNLHMPDGRNQQVAVCYNGTDYEAQIRELLEGSKMEFDFYSMDTREQVFEAVRLGEVECGFVLDGDFDEKIADGDWQELAVCYRTPFSTKAEVAKENFYGALFPIYSKWLLEHTEGEIFRETDGLRLERQFLRHDELVGGELVLSFEELHPDGTKAELPKGASGYPLQGLVELFILLTMLLSAGGSGQKETAQLTTALLVYEKNLCRYLYLIAAGTLVTLMGLVVLLFSQESRGIAVELIGTLGMLLPGGVVVLLFSKLFRNCLTYLSWVTTFVLCFLLLRFGIAGYIAH